MSNEQTEPGVEIEASGAVEVHTKLVLPDVGHLMELALGQGEGGVAALERLVGLQEHVMRVQAENALSFALGEFQADCPHIPQSRKASIATKGGGSYSFTYAPLDVVAKTIRPHLKTHGLSYSFDTTLEGSMMTVVCTVRHRDGATVSGSYTATTENSSGASATQKGGMAHTYAKRLALADALGVITTNADADEAGDNVDATPISADQLREIRQAVKGVDIDRFLGYVGVSSLKDIPAASFGMAMRTLNAKKNRATT